MKRSHRILAAATALLTIAVVVYVVTTRSGQPVVVENPTAGQTASQTAASEASADMKMARQAFLGDGAPKDEAKGAALTRRAAEKGSSRAQGLMGVLYLGGIGVEQNFEEARKWFLQSKDKEAVELARRLQILIEATAKMPPAEKEARMKADYEAARKDIRSSFMTVLEKDNE